MAKSVLIVEDSQKDRAAIAQALAEVPGYRIAAEFDTEAEAKHWIVEHPRAWDLAIIDLVLRQGTGLSLIEPCRETNPSGRVLVLSSFASSGIRTHCRNLGAHGVFHKEHEFARLGQFCADLADAPKRSASRSPATRRRTTIARAVASR